MTGKNDWPHTFVISEPVSTAADGGGTAPNPQMSPIGVNIETFFYF
jgi:hypothetical protein